MIGYATLGTNDLKRAAAFWDTIAAALGISRMMEAERYIAWGTHGGAAAFGIILPYDGQPASCGNGVMIALAAKDHAEVDRVHALALSLGGTDEGAPGPRDMPGFYAGYFRDLDGNKLNVFTMG